MLLNGLRLPIGHVALTFFQAGTASDYKRQWPIGYLDLVSRKVYDGVNRQRSD